MSHQDSNILKMKLTFKFFTLYIFLFKRQRRESAREKRDLLFTGSLAKSTQWLGLGQEEASSMELYSGHLVWVTEGQVLGPLFTASPNALLAGSWFGGKTAGIQLSTDMGRGCYKSWLNPLLQYWPVNISFWRRELTSTLWYWRWNKLLCKFKSQDCFFRKCLFINFSNVFL